MNSKSCLRQPLYRFQSRRVPLTFFFGRFRCVIPSPGNREPQAKYYPGMGSGEFMGTAGWHENPLLKLGLQHWLANWLRAEFRSLMAL